MRIMKEDRIASVGIDGAGSLWVKPATAVFPYMYREAMEIGWDAECKRLFSPKPRQRILGKPTYEWWFKRIIDAAREQGSLLVLDAETQWNGIDTSLKSEIEKLFGRNRFWCCT